MNGAKFLAYVEQCLAPTLKRKDIVMIDNLPAHKAAGIREAIEARGATLRYLPQYSPDLNPIEMPFSKLKARSPRGQRPLSRTILVLAAVSSTKTSRAGSNMPCSRIQRRRARATSARSCSAARRLFF